MSPHLPHGVDGDGAVVPEPGLVPPRLEPRGQRGDQRGLVAVLQLTQVLGEAASLGASLQLGDNRTS